MSLQADKKIPGGVIWMGRLLMLSGEGCGMPKRIGYLYEIMKDESFIRATVIKACYGRHKRKDVAAVLNDIDNVVSNLSRMLGDDTYVPSPYSELRIYDESSQKYRRIKTLPFYPDCLMQWLLVEVLKDPVFLRGMDYWCCASVPGRGGGRIYKGISSYAKHHHKSARYCLQMDVRHYYDSIDIDILMSKLRRRCKDERLLSVLEKVVRFSSDDGKTGIAIGYHLNQWLANFYLEDIDRAIRESGIAGFYSRYMDNMTIIGSNKRKLNKLRKLVENELGKIGLSLKGDWQIFPLSSRPIQAVGYRYTNNSHALLRKRNWLKFRRQVLRICVWQKHGKEIPHRNARAFLSRFGSMRKYAPSRRIFQMVQDIDFADIRRRAV